MDSQSALPYPDLAQALCRAFQTAKVPGLCSAYLFGSHHEGRAHHQSDIDVAVLLDRRQYPTARDRFQERLRLASWLSHVLRQKEVDVVVLNEAPPPFARRIVTTGEQVFCANPAADHDFVRDTQLRAADLEPFLRRTRKIKLDAIAR
jgi:predicted nucleotidyltransferase